MPPTRVLAKIVSVTAYQKSCLIEETVGKIQAAFSLHVSRHGSVLAIFEDLFTLVMRGYIFQR